MKTFFNIISGILVALGGITVVAALFVGLFLLGAYLLQLTWSYAIPAMLPGLVASEAVSGSLTFIQACWVTAFFMVIHGPISRSIPSKKEG